MKRVFRRPSPAMVVAMVALIAALGGTAIAGGALNKKKAKKIANSQITKRAPGLSVASAKSATSAGTAGNVNGVVVTHFFAQDSPGVGFHTIATVGGLTIQASCLGSPTAPALQATLNETSNNFGDVYGNPGFGNGTTGAGVFATLTNGQVRVRGPGHLRFRRIQLAQGLQDPVVRAAGRGQPTRKRRPVLLLGLRDEHLSRTST